MLIIAGGNCSDRSIEIVNNGTFKILRLKTFTGPAAGGCAMVAKSAADTIIIAGTSEQRIDLFRRGLCPIEPQLEYPPHLWRQIISVEQPLLDRLLVELLQLSALLLQPR